MRSVIYSMNHLSLEFPLNKDHGKPINSRPWVPVNSCLLYMIKFCTGHPDAGVWVQITSRRIFDKAFGQVGGRREEAAPQGQHAPYKNNLFY
jgi:hypothetical protein